jgi:hypothetical protein
MIGREPRIGRYSVVACSLQTEQVLYRQDAAPHIDLRRLGEALDPVALSSVSMRQLAMKNGLANFLTNLISEELEKDLSDAFVLISPGVPAGFHNAARGDQPLKKAACVLSQSQSQSQLPNAHHLALS